MLIYVAGPYSSKRHYTVLYNIRAAQKVSEELWSNGYYALCPHINTAFYSGLCPEENFIKGGLKMLSACDAVVLVDGWKDSKGTNLEIKEAFKLNIPVYTSIDNLKTGLCLQFEDYEKLTRCK